MKQLIARLGRTKTVITITVISMLLAIIFTLVAHFFLRLNGVDVSSCGGLIIALMIPLVIAPVASWPTVDLLLKAYRLEEEMRKLATYDSLTDLLSRPAFLERAEYLFRLSTRNKQRFSVLVIDLDYFKKINDQYGHAAGDRALASFGQTVISTIRESDLASRMGGEEFAFFLTNTSSEQALEFSDRLHTAIKENPVEYNGTLIRYTISIGLISSPEVVANNLEELLIMADKVLYRAKENGRDQTVVFNSSFND